VLWAGLDVGTPELTDVADRVDRELNKLGFPRESRGFDPHITVARVKTPSVGAQALIALKERPLPQVMWSVTELCVMQSELTSTGSLDSQLHSAILGA